MGGSACGRVWGCGVGGEGGGSQGGGGSRGRRSSRLGRARAPRRHVARNLLERGVFGVLILLALESHGLLARHDVLGVGADLGVLLLDLDPALVLVFLLLHDERVDVRLDLLLLRVARLCLSPVLLDDRLNDLVHHLLLLEELLVGLGLERHLLLHLLVQLRSHRAPILLAQVFAVRLRLQPALPVRLHRLGHNGLRLGLLGDQVRRLLDLALALLVHVRRLQLLLQRPQFLRLLADALHVLRLAHSLCLAARELGGEPLVLLAQHRLALLRDRRRHQLLRRIHVLLRRLLLVCDPCLDHTAIGTEVLAEHPVGLDRLLELEREIILDPLCRQLRLIPPDLCHRGGRAQVAALEARAGPSVRSNGELRFTFTVSQPMFSCIQRNKIGGSEQAQHLVFGST